MKYLLISILLFVGLCTSAQKIKIDELLEEKVYEVFENLDIGTATKTDPLAMNAVALLSNDQKQLAIVIKASLMDNWHIYAYAEGASPFIMTKIIFADNKGLKAIGEWMKPEATDYSIGIHVYEGELFFIRFFSVDKNQFDKSDKLECGLYYQACDPNQCFPPNTKTINLKLE